MFPPHPSPNEYLRRDFLACRPRAPSYYPVRLSKAIRNPTNSSVFLFVWSSIIHLNTHWVLLGTILTNHLVTGTGYIFLGFVCRLYVFIHRIRSKSFDKNRTFFSCSRRTRLKSDSESICLIVAHIFLDISTELNWKCQVQLYSDTRGLKLTG